MKSTKKSKKKEAPKNSNKVQKKVIKNKDQTYKPPGKKVRKKKKSKIKDKENQRTRKNQTKRKKSNSKKKSARLEQSARILSCVKSSKSDLSPKSTPYSSTAISSERVLESSRLSQVWEKELYRFEVDKKIREELDNETDIASIVEYITSRKKLLKANYEICKENQKKPHNQTLKHEYHKKTLKHFASKIKGKVSSDKTKNNDATSNNTHDNCNNDAKDDLKFMSSILKTFNIPKKSCEKGLEKHMLHFLYEHYRTFFDKYMMIVAKFRNWKCVHFFLNEDVEKAIEKLNEETQSTFPPLREELILKAIQENSSAQHDFCRSSESNKADELKVLDTENTISNKDNTTGVDENNHSVMNNSNTQVLMSDKNYVNEFRITLNEKRYFTNGITNSQFVQNCQHGQKNVNELTEKVSSITSETYPQYFVSNDQHQQNNINELTERESFITCNTDPQCSMLNHYHEQKTTELNESSVPVTNKPYSVLSNFFGELFSKLDENAHPQIIDNNLQNIVNKYEPIENGTSKLDKNALPLTSQMIVPKYENIESNSSSEDENENASVDGDPSPKTISFQDNPAEINLSREDENVSVAGDTLPKHFSFQDNLAESNMPREEENVSVAVDTLPKHFCFQDNLAESISSSEEKNVSMAGDTSPKHFKFQDSLAESNSSSEDENVFVAGDISPKYFSFQDNFAESNSSSEDENVSVAGDFSPKHFSFQNNPSEWESYENTYYSTKEVISERLDRLRASMFYNIF